MPFMIKNAAGQFSSGGARPRFVEFSKAKTWRTLGQAKIHLAQFRDGGTNNVPHDWSVVEMELRSTGVEHNALQLTMPHATQQIERFRSAQIRQAQEKVDRDMAELKRLTEKYGRNSS